MASTRVITCISYKRLASMYNLKNVCVLSNFYVTSNFQQNALYCTKKSITKADPIDQENKIQVGFAEVVKENIISAGYLGVILGGIGIIALTSYLVFDELFSSRSSNNVYSKALDDCIKHPKVRDLLGEPIKGYGEESRRGHRNHISYVINVVNGVRYMRMKFYIQGTRRRGTVYLEVQEDGSGEYVYKYLYVLVDDILQTVIKIVDVTDPIKSHSDETELEFN